VISLLLDPLDLCPDGNRSNNRLDFKAQITSTVESQQPSCIVLGDFGTLGNKFEFKKL